jgi:hypothetical protein
VRSSFERAARRRLKRRKGEEKRSEGDSYCKAGQDRIEQQAERQ